MIIGFGATEIAEANKIINECYEATQSNPNDVEASIKSITQKYMTEGERYKKMQRDEAPERYTYFWATSNKVYDGKYFIEFTMHHINRQHGFSPDGWALWVTHWILNICPVDGMRIFREDT